MLLASFWGINLGFAVLYALQPGSIAATARTASATPFFCVQSFATVGYGRLQPRTGYGNAVSVIEMFTGMLWFAVTAGVVFARFSRPRSRLFFARPR